MVHRSEWNSAIEKSQRKATELVLHQEEINSFLIVRSIKSFNQNVFALNLPFKGEYQFLLIK